MAVKSKVFIPPTVLDNAVPTTYTVPGNCIDTILQFGFSSDNAAVRTVGVTIGGVNYGTALPVPPAGQPALILFPALGGVLTAGQVISLLASAAGDITAWVSGREEIA